MPDYIFKTYLADGGEYFLYGETGDGQAQLTKKTFYSRKACCGYCTWTSGPMTGRSGSLTNC